jgi:hypothetical protein
MFMMRLQVHGIYTIYSFFFVFIKPTDYCQIYLPRKPAKIMCRKGLPEQSAKMIRQSNPPKWSAKATRQNNPPWQLAEFRCDFNPQNLLAKTRCHFNSRYWLAREPPFPAQNPQARPGPPSPPPKLRATEEGEGAGDWPGSPLHPEQVLLLSFPSHEWLHILIWHNIYAFYTERTNGWKYNYITLGERIIARKGWGAHLLPPH